MYRLAFPVLRIPRVRTFCSPAAAEEEKIRQIADRLASARSVVVLTGAGVSAESGMRTFRGVVLGPGDNPEKDMAALWAQFNPQMLATPEAFDKDPAAVSKWYDYRRLGCLRAIPNPGHVALAKMQENVIRKGGRFRLLTQNVDRLHHRAGSTDVVELHGNIMEWRCTKTGKKEVVPPEAFPEFPMKSKHGGLLRPDVVWFGEQLPQIALAIAQEATQSCDLFMTVGTSSTVYPAAGFVEVAYSRVGVFTAEVNAEPTPITEMVDASVGGRSGEILPRILSLAFGTNL